MQVSFRLRVDVLSVDIFDALPSTREFLWTDEDRKARTLLEKWDRYWDKRETFKERGHLKFGHKRC